MLLSHEEAYLKVYKEQKFMLEVSKNLINKIFIIDITKTKILSLAYIYSS